MNYILPKEYIELDYIESTGTQYINLGKKSSDKTKFEFLYESSKELSSSFQNLIGSQNGTIDTRCFIQIESDNDIVFQFPHDASQNLYLRSNGTITISNSVSHIKMDKDTLYSVIYDINNQNFTLNDTKYAYQSSFDILPSINNILFFNRNSTSIPTTNYATGKLYYFKWYEDNKIVLDLIPCMRKIDKKVGLYDKINNNFIDNSGTGTFNYGNPKTEKLLENINEFLRVNL